VEFRSPPRIALAKGENADMVRVSYARAGDFTPKRKGMGEWGCVRRSLNPEKGDIGQVVYHPLADWSQFADYRFPDPYAVGRFDRLKIWLAENRHTLEQKFVYGSLGNGPMTLLNHLRGFENYLVDIILEPERIEVILDGIFHFLEGITEQYAEYNLDAAIISDEQAIQTGPIFPMDLWREVFEPRYKKLFSLVHDADMKVYMHTCGNLSQHLLDLLECGVDIIDNKQPALWMDSEAVDKVRGKMAFETCIDIQSTIHEIALEEIESRVERLIQRLSVPKGGFIATMSNSLDLLRLPMDKVSRMWDAFQNFKMTHREHEYI